MQDLKRLGLKCERLSFDKSPQRDASQFVTVTDVTESGIADKVYCFNEPKRHMGIFNGVLTGQCAEISLNSNQFCNLTTVNQTGIQDKKDFLNRVYAAALIGTLQASYTNFPYLRPKWKEQTEREALLGVSFTGIADANNKVTSEWLKEAGELVKTVNDKYARRIGINPGSRLTTIKPEGTASCVLGSSSGIHARHDQFYFRRIRMNKDDALAQYLKLSIPELVEDDLFSATGVVVTIPQQSPQGAIIRPAEGALDVLDRVLNYHENWIMPGHSSGVNTHNVSVTINYNPDEIDELRKKLWQKRENYAAVSLLPFDGGTYKQAPFESCTQEQYMLYSEMVKDIDLREVKEGEDKTERVETIACAGGLCEI
jgi:ribonucleoside-triphosphate reductase